MIPTTSFSQPRIERGRDARGTWSGRRIEHHPDEVRREERRFAIDKRHALGTGITHLLGGESPVGPHSPKHRTLTTKCWRPDCGKD
jgi:hypothetical protein